MDFSGVLYPTPSDSLCILSPGAIVELFGWPYADVAAECSMLGKVWFLFFMCG